jgi:Tol biopolymer transport system component
LPFAIRAGTSVENDPRERHLAGLRRLTQGWNVESITWSPDAKKLAVVATTPSSAQPRLWIVPLASGAPAQASADAEQVLGVTGTTTGAWRLVYWVATPQGPALRERLESGETRALDAGALKPRGAALSPDGGSLFLVGESAGERGVFALAPEGRGAKLLLADRGAAAAPVVSPDRSYVAWPTEEGGQKRITMASIEGRAPRSIVTTAARAPSFLPGTSRLLFASDLDVAAGEIYAADLGPDAPRGDGSRPERVTFAQADHPSAAPGGRIIAFSSQRGGSSRDLYVARWIDDP